MVCVRAVVLVTLAGCGRLGFSGAPSPDASPPDAAATVPPDALAPTVLFADDFGDAKASQQRWEVETAFAGTTFGVPQGRGGTGALEVTTINHPDGGDIEMALRTLDPGVSTGTLAIRAWFYDVPGLLAPHANVISARASDQESSLVLDDTVSNGMPSEGGLQVYMAPSTAVAGSTTTSSFKLPAPGTWYCLEVDIDVTTEDTGSLRVYCNDQRIAGLDHTATHTDTPYTRVEVGQFAVSPIGMPSRTFGGTMYVDDVVIENVPTLPGDPTTKGPAIGCATLVPNSVP